MAALLVGALMVGVLVVAGARAARAARPSIAAATETLLDEGLIGTAQKIGSSAYNKVLRPILFGRNASSR
jgi:hypothetical protein